MNDESDRWRGAQQSCWRHIAVATEMNTILEALHGLPVNSVIPLVSDTTPTLLIVPEANDDLLKVRALLRQIEHLLETSGIEFSASWSQIALNDEWLLRLQTKSIVIDIMTRLPATQETPLAL